MSLLALQALNEFRTPDSENVLFVRAYLGASIVLDRRGRVLAVEVYPSDKLPSVLKTRGREATSNVSSNFLVDRQEYQCGLSNGVEGGEEAKKSRERRLEKYAHTVERWTAEFLPQAKELKLSSPAIDAVTAFYAAHDPEQPDPELVKQFVGKKKPLIGDVTFTFGGQYVVEFEEVFQILESLAVSGLSEDKGTCIITGRYDDIALGYDKVRGVPNSQPTGASIVSFNLPSARPYGLQGNLAGEARASFPTWNDKEGKIVPGSANVAPTSVVAMRRITGAIKYMLNGDGWATNRLDLGRTAYLIWGDPFLEVVSREIVGKANATIDPDDEMARKGAAAQREDTRIAMSKLLMPRTGLVEQRSVDFHLLGLMGAAGRISITHYQREPSSKMEYSLRTWVEDIAWGAAHRWGQPTAMQRPWRPTLGAMERILVPMPGDNIDGKHKDATGGIKAQRSRLAEQLIRAAYSMGPIPEDAMRRAVHVLTYKDLPGGSGNYTRLVLAGLLGAGILRSTPLDPKEIMTQQLYVLGQIFAIVEFAQRQLTYAQTGRSGAVAPISKLKTFVSGTPRRGIARLMEAYDIAVRHSTMRNDDRVEITSRMRALFDSQKPEELPPRVDAPYLFHVGYHHEEKRLNYILQSRFESRGTKDKKNQSEITDASLDGSTDEEPGKAAPHTSRGKTQRHTAGNPTR